MRRYIIKILYKIQVLFRLLHTEVTHKIDNTLFFFVVVVKTKTCNTSEAVTVFTVKENAHK